jgi:hypothetical protein
MQAVPIPQLAPRSRLDLTMLISFVGRTRERLSLGQAVSLINA